MFSGTQGKLQEREHRSRALGQMGGGGALAPNGGGGFGLKWGGGGALAPNGGGALASNGGGLWPQMGGGLWPQMGGGFGLKWGGAPPYILMCRWGEGGLQPRGWGMGFGGVGMLCWQGGGVRPNSISGIGGGEGLPTNMCRSSAHTCFLRQEWSQRRSTWGHRRRRLRRGGGGNGACGGGGPGVRGV